MIRFRVLGPVEATGPAGELDLGGPKQRALLGRLVLDANRVMSVDQLVDAVWDDEPPPSAQGSLQVLVSKLRKVLRDDARVTSPVARRGNGYLIEAEPAATDLGEFVSGCAATRAALDVGDWEAGVEAASAALTLWRGPLLGEFADREWVRVAAASLDEQRAACELDLVRALLGCDRIGEAVARCCAVDERQSLNENAAWLYALALHRDNRSSDALDVLRRHGKRLGDELGLDPGPALRDLQAGILRQDAGLAHWPRSEAARPTAATVPPVVEPDHAATEPPSVAPEGSDDFVGRAPELAMAEQVLTSGGGAAWLVLTGEAGIGKTTLAERIARRRNGRVARCSCPDDEGVPLWWPVRHLLDALGLDSAAVLATPSDADADSARYAVYDAVSRAFAEATADEPCLVLIEDVHWADNATLRLLNHLAGSAAGRLRGLSVVLTARPAEGNAEVARLLATVARRPDARTIALPPLTAGEVAELAATVAGAPVGRDDAIRLAMRTGGNPFFVCEYARLPQHERERGDVPAVVSAVLERRIGVLDADVLQVLRTAAVIGDAMDIDLLRRVARLDLDELADLLDDAADERIIVAGTGGSGGYAFSHALVREQLLAGLSGMRRQRLHLRVAAAVTGDSLEALVRRATHLVAAGPLAEAQDVFEACRAAAAESERRLEPESAAGLWEHAVAAFDQLPAGSADPGERDDLVVAQIAALARSGRGQTVLDVVDAALLDAVRRGRMDSISRIAGTLLRTSGSWPWAAYGSDPAPLLARLGGLETLVRDHPQAHVRVLAALAVGSCYAPDPDVPDGLSRRAIELAEGLDDESALVDAILGRALAFSGVAGRARESLALLARLQAMDRPTGHDDAIVHGLGYLAQLCLGDVDAAAEHVRQGAAVSDMLRLSNSRVQFRWADASLRLVHTDDLAEVEALLRRAVELHRQTELYESGVFDIAMFTLRWEQGRLTSQEFGHVSPRLMPWAAAVVAVAENDAAAPALLAAELARDEPPTWTTHYRLTVLAHAVADLGAVEFVPALLARLEPLSEHLANIGQVSVAGPVVYAAARLHALAGERDAARAALDVAVRVATAAGAPRWVRACRAFDEQLALPDERRLIDQPSR